MYLDDQMTEKDQTKEVGQETEEETEEGLEIGGEETRAGITQGINPLQNLHVQFTYQINLQYNGSKPYL